MKKEYFLSIAVVFIVSLFYSRFMVSVSMLLMLIAALVDFQKYPSLSFRDFITKKSFSGLLLVFFVVLLSGFNSEDSSQWIHEVKLKLPFLFLPFVFYVLADRIDQNVHKNIHYIFIAVSFISTFPVIANYLIDYESITTSIGKGKSIPTPLDHIHYSIMVSYAVVSSVVFAIKSNDKRSSYVLLFLSLYLFAFLHFLSVRTGLVLAYVGLVIVLGTYVINKKKVLMGLALAAFLFGLPFIAFKTIEPFKRKINYMFWDLAQYQKGGGKSYSDSERLMSFNISLDLIKEKPFFGHGIGDLKLLMKEKHKARYGQKEKYIYPHNQYLFIAACTGMLGALVFFLGLLSPLLFNHQSNILLPLIFVLLLLSFLVENTIQRAVITAFFLFFILINLSVSLKAKGDS